MGRRTGVSLGTKLALGTAFLLAAAIAASAWYSDSTLKSYAESSGEIRRKDLEESIRREALLLARNAVASSGSFLGGTDYTKLEETIRSFSDQNKNMIWFALIDAQNKVEGATRDAPAKLGEVLSDGLTAAVAAAPPGHVEIQFDPANRQRLLLGAPVFVLDEGAGQQVRIGQVRLAIDVSALEVAKLEEIRKGRTRAEESAQRQLIVAGIILLVGMVLAGWQGVRIARPLRALSTQARNIAEGDFGSRAEVRGGDEVAELAGSFNVMAESLGVLVEESKSQAALAREVELARSIQGLMTPPPDVITLGSYKLTGRCEMASACGGDWWSYRQLTDGRLLVVVGDVTGHGMPSAMIAATARGAVEALSTFDHVQLTPKNVLQAIDRAIGDVGNRRLLMTCFAVIISPDGAIAFANAGHTFPYVVRFNGAAVDLSVLPMRSNQLGSVNPLIAAGEHQLAPGNYLVLTSDGLTDRISANGTRFGEKRLRVTLVDHATTDIARVCDRIVSEVNEFGGSQPVDDDITLVVVQYTGTAQGSDERRSQRGAAA